MTGLRTLSAAMALGAAAVSLPAAANASYEAAFLDAFRNACMPERRSYRRTLANVRALGWHPAAKSENDELRAVVELANKAMAEDAGPDWLLEMSAYEQVVAGRLNYLVVSRIVAPRIVRLVSCGLYDFEATDAIDPQPVSDFLGIPIERTRRDKGFTAHFWGAPPSLPGTQGASLVFQTDESKHVSLTGFSGLVLKIDTSEPDPVN